MSRTRVVLHQNRKRITELTSPLRAAVPFVAAGAVLPEEFEALAESHAIDRWRFHTKEKLGAPDPVWSEPQKPLDLDVVTHIAHFPGELISFRNRHALDTGRRVIYEAAVPFDELGIPYQRLEVPEPVDGLVAYLSNSWSDNYAHFLTLVVPHLRFYETLPVVPDFYYVGAPVRRWQLDVLAIFGIPPERVLEKAVQGTSALVTYLVSDEPHALPDAQRFMQSRLPCNFAAVPSRRLFVGRGPTTTRRMLDEAIHAKRLEEAFGFEYIESTAELSVEERADLFGAASHVVMPHGAAQASLLFSPPGTKVLELRTGSPGPPLTGFQSICWSLEQELGQLRGDPIQDRSRTGLAQDISLAPDRLTEVVREMLSA